MAIQTPKVQPYYASHSLATEWKDKGITDDNAAGDESAFSQAAYSLSDKTAILKLLSNYINDYVSKYNQAVESDVNRNKTLQYENNVLFPAAKAAISSIAATGKYASVNTANSILSNVQTELAALNATEASIKQWIAFLSDINYSVASCVNNIKDDNTKAAKPTPSETILGFYAGYWADRAFLYQYDVNWVIRTIAELNDTFNSHLTALNIYFDQIFTIDDQVSGANSYRSTHKEIVSQADYQEKLNQDQAANTQAFLEQLTVTAGKAKLAPFLIQALLNLAKNGLNMSTCPTTKPEELAWTQAPLPYKFDMPGGGKLTQSGLKFYEAAVPLKINNGDYKSEIDLFYDWQLKPEGSSWEYWRSLSHHLWELSGRTPAAATVDSAIDDNTRKKNAFIWYVCNNWYADHTVDDGMIDLLSYFSDGKYTRDDIIRVIAGKPATQPKPTIPEFKATIALRKSILSSPLSPRTQQNAGKTQEQLKAEADAAAKAVYDAQLTENQKKLDDTLNQLKTASDSDKKALTDQVNALTEEIKKLQAQIAEKSNNALAPYTGKFTVGQQVKRKSDGAIFTIAETVSGTTVAGVNSNGKTSLDESEIELYTTPAQAIVAEVPFFERKVLGMPMPYAIGGGVAAVGLLILLTRKAD